MVKTLKARNLAAARALLANEHNKMQNGAKAAPPLASQPPQKKWKQGEVAASLASQPQQKNEKPLKKKDKKRHEPIINTQTEHDMHGCQPQH